MEREAAYLKSRLESASAGKATPLDLMNPWTGGAAGGGVPLVKFGLEKILVSVSEGCS